MDRWGKIIILCHPLERDLSLNSVNHPPNNQGLLYNTEKFHEKDSPSPFSSDFLFTSTAWTALTVRFWVRFRFSVFIWCRASPPETWAKKKRQNDGASFKLKVHTVSCRLNYLHISLCPKCNSATNSTEKKNQGSITYSTDQKKIRLVRYLLYLK